MSPDLVKRTVDDICAASGNAGIAGVLTNQKAKSSYQLSKAVYGIY